MLKPIIIASIEEPPYDIIGKGAPTIGSKPRTMDMLTATYIKKADAKPKQYNLAKLFLQFAPILVIL
tara:strand:- start:11 stop:211 length:201 start_codon:yes stop_codon:yes gene_type:complete